MIISIILSHFFGKGYFPILTRIPWVPCLCKTPQVPLFASLYDKLERERKHRYLRKTAAKTAAKANF